MKKSLLLRNKAKQYSDTEADSNLTKPIFNLY